MLDNVEFYREVLDNLYDGVFFVSNSGAINYWNRGAELLTGYSQADVAGKNYCEIFKPLDKYGNCLVGSGGCPIREALNADQLNEVDAYISHKDGHLLPISIRIAPVRQVGSQLVVAVEIHNSNSPRYALRQRLEELQEMAMYDPLTGVANRRYIEMNIETRLEELRRYQWNFAVMFMDVDNFKQLNDTYGHLAGDKVLKMISSTMVNSLRSFDVIGRWGGEEFVILLVNVSEDNLLRISDRFRRLIENSKLPMDDGTTLSATVSVGATIASQNDTKDLLVHRVDELMYQSKKKGRNCVTVDC